MISMRGIDEPVHAKKNNKQTTTTTIKTKQTMKTYQKAQGARLKGFPLAKCGII